MQGNKLWFAASVACLLAASTGFADHKPGHVGGDGEAVTPAIITFRDCQAGFPSAPFANLHPGSALMDICPVPDDRVKSDTGLAYEDGVQGVEAFLGSKANSGNVFLRLARSTRGLLLDFSDCASPAAECNPPFTSAISSDLTIKVAAADVKRNGLFGMAVGESITAVPARITYSLLADTGPGFVEFDPNKKGTNPCKNKSNFVTVIRTGEATWEIIADPNTIACVLLPGGSGFGGTYRMPFQFTVQIK